MTPDPRINPYLSRIVNIEENISRIRDGVCFARCYYLIHRVMPVHFRFYLWCVEKFIKISDRLARVKEPPLPFQGTPLPILRQTNAQKEDKKIDE